MATKTLRVTQTHLPFLTDRGSTCHTLLVWWCMPISDIYLKSLSARDIQGCRKFAILHSVSVTILYSVFRFLKVRRDVSTDLPNFIPYSQLWFFSHTRFCAKCPKSCRAFGTLDACSAWALAYFYAVHIGTWPGLSPNGSQPGAGPWYPLP